MFSISLVTRPIRHFISSEADGSGYETTWVRGQRKGCPICLALHPPIKLPELSLTPFQPITCSLGVGVNTVYSDRIHLTNNFAFEQKRDSSIFPSVNLLISYHGNLLNSQEKGSGWSEKDPLLLYKPLDYQGR